MKIPPPFDASQAAALRHIHQLEVHLIELEQQNTELTLAKERAEASLLNMQQTQTTTAIVANEQLNFQNEEKLKRAEELIIANKELLFQNEEKEKRADELSIAIATALKLKHELEVYQMELKMQNLEIRLSQSAALTAADKYSELYDFAPTGYFSLSREGEIVELNYSCAGMLGKDRRNLKNSRFGFFVSKDTRPDFNAFLEKVFTSQAKENCEVTLSIAENPRVFVHLAGLVKKNGEQCLVTMVDITGIKLAEAALLLSNAKHSSMISNISDVIGIIGVNGFMKYKSPNIEKLFGWKPQDLVGTDGWLTVHPDDLERIQKEFFKLLQKDNAVTTVEYKYKCKDGSYKPIELTATNLANDPIIGGVLLNYHDITGRKQIEEELQLVTTRLLLAAHAGGVGVWDYDVVNNILLWDDRMFALYGIEQKDFKGVYENWQAGVHPDDKERGDKEIIQAINGEKEFDTEFRVCRPDGSVHNIRAMAVVQRNDTGQALRMIGTNWDITELRKSEKLKLDHSESRYRSIFEGSSDGIMMTDVQSKRIILANPAQCKMLGYSEEELQTMTIEMIHPKDTFQDTLALFESMARREKTFIENIQCLKKNGEIFYADISSSFIDVNGRTCLAGFFHDITDRKMAEKAIRANEEKYNSILNASHDGILLADIKGFISEVSTIGLQLIGAAQRDDLVGKDIFEFVPSEAHDSLREILARTTREGLAQNIGLKIKRIDQSVFDGEISATLMQDSDGAPLSFLIIVRNIAHRKKKEAIQIHADRMSTLGEMAAGIAHEIGQPLNIISMVMDKILFETAKTEIVDIGFLQTKSDKIFENITRIRDIIDHVRAFSRSHDDYILSAFNINSSIVNASSMIMEQFKHHGINLNLQLEQQLPKIVGNTYKFEQVILNLLVNAKDAVNELKSKQLEDFEMQVGIRSYQENQHIIVEITDNGIGISNDDIQNVMLPFYTTKEEGKGTGLGLPICQQIIKEMGGAIEISNEGFRETKVKLILSCQQTKTSIA